MKALSFLAAFIGGAAVGAAIGILFAPEKGTETRDKIAEAQPQGNGLLGGRNRR